MQLARDQFRCKLKKSLIVFTWGRPAHLIVCSWYDLDDAWLELAAECELPLVVNRPTDWLSGRPVISEMLSSSINLCFIALDDDDDDDDGDYQIASLRSTAAVVVIGKISR